MQSEFLLNVIILKINVSDQVTILQFFWVSICIYYRILWSISSLNVCSTSFWMYVLIVEGPTSRLDIWRRLPATGLSTDGMTRFSTEAPDSGEALIAKGDEEKWEKPTISNERKALMLWASAWPVVDLPDEHTFSSLCWKPLEPMVHRVCLRFGLQPQTQYCSSNQCSVLKWQRRSLHLRHMTKLIFKAENVFIFQVKRVEWNNVSSCHTYCN